MDEAVPSQTPSLAIQLAGQILNWIRERNLKAGAHLAEQNLAEAMRVSRTPVRMALLLLQEKELVEHRPNRGFYLATTEAELEYAEIAEESETVDPIYFKIADDYLSGKLPGKVYERDLMRHYGITKTRIQQMLSRINEEGWVERLPGHGWQFLEVINSPDAYAKSFRFRALIETAALLEPGYTIDKKRFDHVRQVQLRMINCGLQKFAKTATFDAGSSFHETIVAGSGNPFYIDAIRRVNKLRRLMEYRIHQVRDRSTSQCLEHLQLLDLIECGEMEKAAGLLRSHLEEVASYKITLVAPPE